MVVEFCELNTSLAPAGTVKVALAVAVWPQASVAVKITVLLPPHDDGGVQLVIVLPHIFCVPVQLSVIVIVPHPPVAVMLFNQVA